VQPPKHALQPQPPDHTQTHIHTEYTHASGHARSIVHAGDSTGQGLPIFIHVLPALLVLALLLLLLLVVKEAILVVINGIVPSVLAIIVGRLHERSAANKREWLRV
jgi:hypothetical protein